MMQEDNLHNLSPVLGHIGYFWFAAIVSNAGENTLMQVEAQHTGTNILMPSEKSGSDLPSVKNNSQILIVVLTQNMFALP